jgi:hypothetical protein
MSFLNGNLFITLYNLFRYFLDKETIYDSSIFHISFYLNLRFESNIENLPLTAGQTHEKS